LRYLEEDNFYECFRILLKYYDKYYERGLSKKESGSVIIIDAETVNSMVNSQLILNKINY
jgi:tRNA 2-selenouridine synthase